MDENFSKLLDKYLGKNISEEEKTELARLVELPVYQLQLAALIDETFNDSKSILIPEPDSEGIYQKILEIGKLKQPAKIVAVKKRRPVLKWIAAASIVFIAIATVYVTQRHKINENQVALTKIHDVKPPQSNRATITLANGQQVYLDSVSTGAVALQGNAKVLKTDESQVMYQPIKQTSQAIEYNTLTNPRGSKVINLTLADGTKVWLNSESSLRFPTAFVGKERKVEINGEAYFEVAHDAEKPFVVNKGDMDVQVLGTHFNINTYSDEPSTKITLLEGRVQVKKKDQYVYLNPGQQAILLPSQNSIRVSDDADVDEAVAWKNGRFLFNSADIETIMRQVARWYDVDVVYQNKTGKTFSGGLPRSNNVSALLKILEASGSVNFEINGKQIFVKPK